MTKKEKQYQAALDATFTKEGYLKSNLNPKDIAARVYTAAEIAIGDGGFRAKEIVENFAQLMEFMKSAYDNDVRYMRHDYTKHLVSKETVLSEFLLNVIGDENYQTG